MADVSLDELRARTEAARVRTREDHWRGLAEAAWRRGRALAEAGDLAGAEHELDRARRISPTDGTVLFDLAGVLLRAGAFGRAAALFERLAREHDLPDAWCGLSAAALRAGDPARAAAALARALSRAVPSPSALALAEPVARACGAPGWCGLDGDGTLRIGPGVTTLDPPRLDGRPVRGGRLPRGWAAGWELHVTAGGVHLLGSPVSIPAITRLDAFATVADGVLGGWAWHPGDPGRTPRLTLAEGGGTVRTLACRADAAPVPGMPPLARPRAIPPTRLDGPATLCGPGGRPVPGSPLRPGLLASVAREAARPAHLRDPAVPLPIPALPYAPPPARAQAAPRGACVVIPVHGNTAATLACLASVRATVPRGTPVIVVDDASRDPALIAALDRLAQGRRIRLIRLAQNAGFPAAANAGLAAEPGRDAVLLNSDTLVPPDWLPRLREAAYSAADIGTATPISDDATILTYRGPPAPVAVLDRLAQAANGAATADIPVGIGFCLYLRRDCLDELGPDGTGPLRAELFAQGYGEENDLCLRARALGWRSVAVPGLFVHHAGAGSFGAARTHLMARNAALLEQLHPGHDALIAAWVARDPLGPFLRRMDALRWAEDPAAGPPRGSLVIATHAGGGGVDRVVRDRCAAAVADGLRAVVLRPGPDGACSVSDGPGDTHPHLRFRLPGELPALASLLRPGRPVAVELHHTLGHGRALLDLPAALGVPYDVVVHDYASFCPRIALVSRDRRYCGEPDVAGCEACVADLGSLLEEELGVRELRARSAAVFAGARRVVAPSADAAGRVRRHFPGLEIAVQPWTATIQAAPRNGPGPVRRVCVVGAIGLEKGYEVLLACLRDARARSLPLEFVLVGYSSDDERLLAAGPLRITGAFEPGEARELIAAQAAHMAFLPSVWPETWCFALDDCWEAGLDVAAFDLGGPAERIRASGRGWILPFHLPLPRVNDALLSCSRPPRAVT